MSAAQYGAVRCNIAAPVQVATGQTVAVIPQGIFHGRQPADLYMTCSLTVLPDGPTFSDIPILIAPTSGTSHWGVRRGDMSPVMSSNAADPWGDVMKFIIDFDFPQEPFNTYLRQGTAGVKIGEVLGAIKPEVIYFTDNGAGRGAMMIVDLDSASQAPHVTEPLMLTFGASVHYRVAMSPEKLQSAGLDRYAAA